MPLTRKTLRVFVSSTFAHVGAGRKAFPLDVVPVGICIDEMKRCQWTTLKANFVMQSPMRSSLDCYRTDLEGERFMEWGGA
jgi:hypothetical protein